MNERIKELVYEAERFARDKISASNQPKFNVFFQEKFAELIVKECAYIAWNHEPDENGPIETEIKKRFGVE